MPLVPDRTVPSPKLIVVEAIVPSVSVEPAALAVMEPPTSKDVAFRVKAAIGGAFTVTEKLL